MVKRQSEVDMEIERIRADGYTIIDPKQNAFTAILADLGKADLSPAEVEALCQTAKDIIPGSGFVRYDLLPCRCWRVYRGLILSAERTTDSLSMQIGGFEGVKPCQKHTELVGGMKWET
jgi:hypothetical protein